MFSGSRHKSSPSMEGGANAAARRRLLTVEIIEARNLMASSKSGKSDPVATVSLTDLGGREIKKEGFSTKAKKDTLAPVWNETFVFGTYIPHSCPAIILSDRIIFPLSTISQAIHTILILQLMTCPISRSPYSANLSWQYLRSYLVILFFSLRNCPSDCHELSAVLALHFILFLLYLKLDTYLWSRVHGVDS